MPDGELLVPTEHARGPWDAGAMHGGAPAGLVARAIERLDAPVPMRCARLTFEFLRAVPMEPVAVEARVVRGGKRLQLVEAAVRANGEEVLRARATMLRVADDVHLPPEAAQPDPPVPGPAEGRPEHWTGGDETTGFHLTAMELRFARGDWLRGPALGWFRLRLPLVAGETPTALQRAVTAADFGNGLSRALDFRTHLFVNTDLTIHLEREPAGEWVGVDARTDLDRAGIGQATSVLRDERGRLGIAAQSLFVDERRPPAGGDAGATA